MKLAENPGIANLRHVFANGHSETRHFLTQSYENYNANTNDEWDNAVHLCWEEMVTVFSEDMSKTICFLETDCTASEYSWLSEVFEEIAEKTQSREFIAALRKLAVKYPEETEQYNVMSFINGAEACINP